MNKIIYTLFIVTITSCIAENQPAKMRRFTFAAVNMLADSASFQQINGNQKLQEVLHNGGVVNYNYCAIDSVSCLILDMEESFNLKKTQALLKRLSQDHPSLQSMSDIISGKYQLLDRMYKLEQKQVFQAEEGQLIPRQQDKYARFILTLEIVNDPELAMEYKAVHAMGKAWPEITQNMKTVGIHEMEIYLMGFRAFLIMDAKPDFDWAVDGEKWGQLPREKEWQAYVAKFQKTDPESKAAEKWKTMCEVRKY